MENQSLPEIVYGDRIYLKKHQLDLANVMFRAVDNDRKRLGEFLPWVTLSKTVGDTIDYIKHTHEQWDKRELFDFGIFLKNSKQYIGNVGVHTISWGHKHCEIGYWITSEFEGQGYISESVLLLERACFSAGFHRVEIRCNSNNVRSASVPKRLGYQLDGRLREDRFEGGTYYDTLIFGKIIV